MKKRLIALMISMLMTVSVATACGNETTVDADDQKDYEQAYRTNYDLDYRYSKAFENVSILVHGEDKLHKGDVSFNNTYSRHNSTYISSSNMQILEFDCGKKIITSEPITVYDVQVVDNREEQTVKSLEGNERPDNIDLCEECFGVE